MDECISGEQYPPNVALAHLESLVELLQAKHQTVRDIANRFFLRRPAAEVLPLVRLRLTASRKGTRQTAQEVVTELGGGAG